LAEYGVLLAFLSVGAAASSMVLEEKISSLWDAPTSVLSSLARTDAVSGSGLGTVAAAETRSHVLESTSLRSGESRPLIVAGNGRKESTRETTLPESVLWQSMEANDSPAL
jgi:Flp pilus assembly pilin Flp